MQLFKSKSVKNFSNFFGEGEGLERLVKASLEAESNSVFGVEYHINEGGVEIYSISPPHLRADGARSHRELHTDDLSIYEGYLLNPYFLPLYMDVCNDFSTLLMDVKETACVQWLFQKAAQDNWRYNALDMYASYLNGNDYPFTSRFIRTLQDKTLGIVDRISNAGIKRPFLTDVEEKVLSEAYRFQLRVAVRDKETVTKIEELLSTYDFYNALRLVPASKHAKENFKSCVIDAQSYYQILSYNELASIFSLQKIAAKKYKEDFVPENKTEGFSDNIIELLPHSENSLVAPYTEDENVVSAVAEALKRVKLIKTARLYNTYVKSGVRLTVAQFDIPKGKNITDLQKRLKDIQAALGVNSLGIEQGDEPDSVRFTLPNEEQAVIALREVIDREEYRIFAKENDLAFPVGVDEINNPIYLSLSKLVHLMIAGTTGSGKSVFINSLALSLLLNYSPLELRMVMIDPKQVELFHFKDFPHVEEVITDMSEATSTLYSLVKEMETRYALLSSEGARNIQLYNKKVADSNKLPFIVCIIDEYADLKDVDAKVEEPIARLGQKARAAGIHLVLATQRPSTDIISGRVKAVIPNAISFNLNNSSNYKTVFGVGIGGTTLLGSGDGIMRIEGYPKEFQRFQSTIIAPDEVSEESVFKNIAAYYNKRFDVGSSLHYEKENTEDSDLLYKLKQVIADTKETRIAPLREALGVKTETVSKLMTSLVDEGWLKKHDSKAKGYELIVSDTILGEWKTIK